MEELKVVPLFTKYSISNKGRVRNNKTGRILKSARSTKGYRQVKLYRSTFDYEILMVHLLVLESFGEQKPFEHYQGNHKDLDKDNNTLENLEWLSPSGNVQHSLRNGARSHLVGEKANRALLSNEQVREIRKLLDTGLSHRKIASRYGVGRNVITNINTRDTYSSVV